MLVVLVVMVVVVVVAVGFRIVTAGLAKLVLMVSGFMVARFSCLCFEFQGFCPRSSAMHRGHFFTVDKRRTGTGAGRDQTDLPRATIRRRK